MKVFVDVHDKRWNKVNVDFEKIAGFVAGAKYKNAEVSIILTDDSEIHQINKQYRNVDRPTNVLSFELGDDVLLGDIYISYDTVKKEAREQEISFHDHVAHMVVHGVLHLMGYDHITDDEAQIMEFKEIKVLQKMGINNPYADEVRCVNGDCCPGARFVAWKNKLKIRENGLVQYLLYALFGAVASFGFAPFYQWWWTIIGIGGAYWLTFRNNNIGGFWKSLGRVAPFGAMYAIAMFWWTLHSIYVAPELTQQFAIWTVPGVVGLAVAGVFIFSWPFVALARCQGGAIKRVVVFATVWTLVLWAREWMFTGFPWNPIANITMQIPILANSMALWGALGLTLVIVGGTAAVVEFCRKPKLKSTGAICAAFVAVMIVGAVAGWKNMQLADVGYADENVLIRIVQPATSQSQKATHNRDAAIAQAEDNLKNLFQLAMQPGNPEIIIFPETTYPFVVMAHDKIEFVAAINKPVIMGAMSIDSGGMFNSMIVTQPSGEIDKIYSKSHLVPFGEYKPMGILPAPVNLTPGTGPEIIEVVGFNFVPAVCYEVVFSDSLMPQGNTERLNAIVNITNDNWFGNTPGTYQHLDMVRRYAIESGLPVVRANYSGISAFVASDGEVVSALPVGQPGILDGFVWGEHKTPYRIIGLNGWMIIILIVAVAVVRWTEKQE